MKALLLFVMFGFIACITAEGRNLSNLTPPTLDNTNTGCLLDKELYPEGTTYGWWICLHNEWVRNQDMLEQTSSDNEKPLVLVDHRYEVCVEHCIAGGGHQEYCHKVCE